MGKRRRVKKVSTTNPSTLKSRAIQEALSLDNLASLVTLGQSRLGFVNDRNRRKVWPKLLHCGLSDVSASLEPLTPEIIRQIHVDAQRTRFFGLVDAQDMIACQSALERIVQHVLRAYPRYAT